VNMFTKILSVLVLLFVLGLFVAREYNIKGQPFGAVPTADLSISLEGKTAIVTGANTGIGTQIAGALAGMGANVILACRDQKKGETAKDTIISPLAKSISQKFHHKLGQLTVETLDLASFESIRNFAKRVDLSKGLDILVNNAGMANENIGKTKDGLCIIMGTNHFGPFLLTQLLLPKIPDGSRIVTVSSNAHRNGLNISFADPDCCDCTGFVGGMTAYSNSKMGNVLMTQILANNLREQKSKTITNSNHPGFIKTDILREAHGWMAVLLSFFTNTLAMDPWQGAQNTIYLATSPEVANVSGKYFEHFKEREVADPDTQGFKSHQEFAQAFWDLSLKITGLKS